ncbi:hypothetical protein EIP86_009666 [Pleurotus ostreatoroseus]|nr:hypothetical protein EIP86_009666 [Pleurotus ostreatoroseus]
MTSVQGQGSADKIAVVAKKLHHIVLGCIFESAFPAHEENLLDYSLSRGPNNPWCQRLRTKKAVILVSRECAVLTVKFLYRDITIRRISGLIALAETLHQKPQYGSIVKTLQLDCLVPTSMNKIAAESVCLVLDSCPKLYTLRFGTFFISSFLTHDWPLETELDQMSADATITAILKHVHTLRGLAFTIDTKLSTPYTPPVPLLTQGSRLISLTLSVPTQWRAGMDALSLPDLRELSLIVITSGNSQEIRRLAGWSLPSLVTLALYTPGFLPDFYTTPFTSDLWVVLAAHGSNLQFLDFSSCWISGGVENEYDLDQVCPRLKHLVLHIDSPAWPTFRSSSLHVDMWHYEKQGVWKVKPTIQADRKVVQRKAERIGCGSLRYLSKGLRTLYRLPMMLPPRPVGDLSADDAHDTLPFYLHDIYGMHLLELGSGLMLEDEYPSEDYFSLWPDIAPIPFSSHPDNEDSELSIRSDSDPSSDSDSDDESWTWDDDELNDIMHRR